ncbi:MAG: HD domain-containing protein [Clostridia bacterium]|nr:HD domain-containing protein [Clostridia bacterium]
MTETEKAAQHTIPIPDNVLCVMKKLRNSGYESFVVGGCVRDALLGKTPKDYDITTNALPLQVKTLFAQNGFRVIETGLRHGTVTVLSNGTPVEVTTYRIDGAYSDGRHPDSVTFSDGIADDLSRRDFTINAMAYSPDAGFVDLFGGAEDLKNKRICCVGNPQKRFEEDALRMLRALRFSSVLGFAIAPETSDQIHRQKHLLEHLAKERITAEFLGLLCGQNASGVMREYRDIIAEILPPIAPMFGFAQHNLHHDADVWEHTLRVVDAVPSDDIVLRLAALLHDVGKPHCFTADADGVGHFYGHPAISADICEQIFSRYLRTDKKTASRVTLLVKSHDEPLLPPSRRILHRRLTKYGEEVLRQLLALHRADVIGQAPAYRGRLDELDEAERILDTLVQENACMRIGDLALNGRDLQNMGVAPGPPIGALLRALLSEVCDGVTPNTPDALRARAAQLIPRLTTGQQTSAKDGFQ